METIGNTRFVGFRMDGVEEDFWVVGLVSASLELRGLVFFISQRKLAQFRVFVFLLGFLRGLRFGFLLEFMHAHAGVVFMGSQGCL